MITTNSYTQTKYTCYELSKNNVLGVTYWETDCPEAEDRSTPRYHNVEIAKLMLNNDDVTEKLEGIWDDIVDFINENQLQ